MDEARERANAATEMPGESPRQLLGLFIVIGLLPVPAFIAGMFFDRQRVINAVARRLTASRRQRSRSSAARTQLN